MLPKSCKVYPQKFASAAGQVLQKLKEVSLTCQKLEDSMKRLETQSHHQKGDLDCIKSSCNIIVDTLNRLLVEQPANSDSLTSEASLFIA